MVEKKLNGPEIKPGLVVTDGDPIIFCGEKDSHYKNNRSYSMFSVKNDRPLGRVCTKRYWHNESEVSLLRLNARIKNKDIRLLDEREFEEARELICGSKDLEPLRRKLIALEIVNLYRKHPYFERR